jgi:hypothetical protein
MTKKDTIKLFAIFTAAYPRFDTFKDPERLRPVIELWTEMLADIPYPVAEVAAKKLILESPYPPTISDMRKQIVDITMDPADRIDGATAWGEVVQAIRKYGYYRPEEALSSMSPRAAKVVRMIGWREICACEEPGVIRGQFIKMYDSFATREKQVGLLPIALNKAVQQIGDENRKFKLIEGGKQG